MEVSHKTARVERSLRSTALAEYGSAVRPLVGSQHQKEKKLLFEMVKGELWVAKN